MQENPFAPGKKTYCTFYIVRHGETEWNVKKVIQGQRDSPLTSAGIKQIKDTAKELKDVHFDVVFSSDSLRAKRTAEIIVLEHKLAVRTTKLLRERNYGHLEGQPTSTLDEVYKIFENLTDKERFQYKIAEDIESDEDIISRFITFIREVSIIYPGRKILLATHGGLMRALLVHLGWATYKNFFVRNIGHTAYIKLLSDGADFFIEETRGIKRDPSTSSG